MLRTFHSDEVAGPKRKAPKGTVIIEVVSRPTIVTYEASESSPRCWVGNARVNPDYVQDVLAGKDSGSTKKIETRVELAAEVASSGEADWHRYDDRYDDLADAENQACDTEISERRRAACEGRENRRAWRKMRRHYTVVTPHGVECVRKSAHKTGDVSGRKHRNRDIVHVRMEFEVILWPEPEYDECNDDDGLENLGMVSGDVIVCEEAMIWAAEYNDDDEWIEAIRPTLEMIAA